MSGTPELPIEIWTKIFSFLDYESLQDNAILVCKDWYKIIRSNSNLSGRLVLHLPMKPPNMDINMGFMDIDGPGRQAGQFDCMTSTLTASSVSAIEINPILKSWKALKYLEIPHLKAMKKLDLKPLKKLEKVTMNAKFPTSKSLPHWLKINQITFDPRKGQGYESLSLEYASKLVIVFDRNEVTMIGADLANIAKMKNLETLQIEWTWYEGDLDFLSPLLTTLQATTSQIQSLIINYSNSPNGCLMEVINKIQELFPRISSISMNDHDNVFIQVGHIGDIFDFRKMEKLSLSLKECQSGPLDGQEYFLAKAKGNQVKEIHFRGGGFGFFKDLFLQFYNEGVFPKLEKLIIDHDDRYGRKTIDNPCEFEMWELSHLPQMLEDLAKIKYLHIWSLKTSLKVTPSQKDKDAKLEVFNIALQIINNKFPIESEMDLIETKSGIAIIKRKWQKAFIDENVDIEEYDGI